MRLEESVIHCRNHGKKGDFFFPGPFSGEGCCQPLPYSGRIERKKKFHEAAGKQRRQKCVDDAMDMVQG